MKLKGQSAKWASVASILIGLVAQLPLVTNAQTSADLAISMYNTSLDVYTNDYMPYTMFVTNLGPGTVPSVIVTNILPSGFSVVDSSLSYTLSGNSLVYNLGSLTNLAVQKIIVRAKAPSPGVYAFSTSVHAANNTDPNSANNSASFNVGVMNYLSGNLSAGLVSTQFVDSQSGLNGQYIQVTNNGASPVFSARVVVSGLTNQLWMPAGTNAGIPFVIYGAPIAAGQIANLLLEFSPTNYFSFSNSQLQAFATPLATLNPPGNLGAPIAIYSEAPESSSAVAPGAIITSWVSITNRSYTILYSDNQAFSNPVLSPQIVPPTGSNLAQWIDYGPPATISFPTNTAPRYYRVFLNP